MTHERAATETHPEGDRGASSIEYSLIGALIAAVVVFVVGLLGLDVLDLWQRVGW